MGGGERENGEPLQNVMGFFRKLLFPGEISRKGEVQKNSACVRQALDVYKRQPQRNLPRPGFGY